MLGLLTIDYFFQRKSTMCKYWHWMTMMMMKVIIKMVIVSSTKMLMIMMSFEDMMK